MKFYLTIILAFLFFEVYSDTISIIPQPLSVELKSGGGFRLDKDVTVFVSADSSELLFTANQVVSKIKELMNVDLPVQQATAIPEGTKSIVLLQDDNAKLGEEGYVLNVDKNHVIIKGSPHGIFYGAQTLFQLFPLRKGVTKRYILVPALDIIDKPRFAWRGFMLDVGRYFQSVSVVKRYIDFLVMHKINTFHWHLADDQGWRIEIKKYPKLTEIGAWRKDSQLELSGKQMAFSPHGGFYTQEEINEVIKYAADRFISVIPEIEMPGHSYAALASYPEFSCSGGPFEVSTAWKVHEDIYCAGNEQVYAFLEDVLTEIAELFPAPYIHIGGDEAPKTRWKACPKCQQRIKEEGLKDENELQTYMIKRMENFLSSKGKKIIGWDEITEGGLSPNATVMGWRGFDGVITAARQGHDAIIAHSKFTYLDHYQSEPSLEPLAWAGLVPNGYTTLQKSYSLEPVPVELTQNEQKHIIGLQGQLWMEYIHTTDRMDYMTFPRLAALSEVMWSEKDSKNWDYFKRRMDTQYKRYEEQGINYSKSAYNVYFETKIDSLNNTATVSLYTENHNPTIRYTLDGSDPTNESSVYMEPFTVTLPLNVKAANFITEERISEINQKTIVIIK